MSRRSGVTALGILLLSAAARAEPPTGEGTGPPQERARTYLVLRMAEALGLSDEKAIALNGILRGAEDQRHQLRQRRRALEDHVRAALAHVPLDQAELGRLVAEGNAIDQEMAGLPEKSFREVQKELTVEQQARLILLRPELQREIRGAARRRMEERPERPR